MITNPNRYARTPVFRDDEPPAAQEVIDRVTADLLSVTRHLTIEGRRGTNGSITVRGSYQDTHAERNISAVILRQWDRDTAKWIAHELCHMIAEAHFLTAGAF